MFYGAIHWNLCWRSLGICDVKKVRPSCPLGPHFFNITDFYHYALMHPLKKIFPHHWVGPRKSGSNRAPHLLTPALPYGPLHWVLFIFSAFPVNGIANAYFCVHEESSKFAYEYIRLETLSNMTVLDGTVLEFYNVHGEQNVTPER